MTGKLISQALHRTPREPASCALITGATGGIGEAFARALPEETQLILCGRDREKLDSLAAEFGDRAQTVAADLASEDGLQRVADAAGTAECDLLMNNAGLGAYGRFVDAPYPEHRDVIRVNIEAVTALIHQIVPGMVERAHLNERRAGLINVASSLAFFPVPTFATYAAAKAFVLSFTESFAAEMQDEPIDILVACPGAVRTDFGARAGYRGGGIPGAMAPEKVAKEALAALGRQTTVLIGPASAAAFTPVALARSMFGRAFMQASRVMERVADRG